MTQDEIKRLADRIVSGKATDTEIHQYNALFNSFQSQEISDELIFGNKEQLELNIRNGILNKTPSKLKVIRLNRYKWAAAAAFIITGSIAIFLLYNTKPKQTVSVAAIKTELQKNDIAPGQKGAILTLSNGKTIILDSAHNGALADEGSANIVKNNGEIVYSNQGKSAEIIFNTMTTPKGRQYNLVLADGSKVWLNASSSITFPTNFSGNDRTVSITGEAYFEIAHNEKKPFIVQKGEVAVQVYGTHFNMNAYDDESAIHVTLLEGSVKVTKGNASNFIKPGQQAQVQRGNVRVINNVDLEDVMAWKNGLFHFEGTDIESLMRQLGRWYDIDIVYNKKVNDLFYAEIPRNTMLSNALKALELTGKVHFNVQGKKVFIAP